MATRPALASLGRRRKTLLACVVLAVGGVVAAVVLERGARHAASAYDAGATAACLRAAPEARRPLDEPPVMRVEVHRARVQPPAPADELVDVSYLYGDVIDDLPRGRARAWLRFSPRAHGARERYTALARYYTRVGGGRRPESHVRTLLLRRKNVVIESATGRPFPRRFVAILTGCLEP